MTPAKRDIGIEENYNKKHQDHFYHEYWALVKTWTGLDWTGLVMVITIAQRAEILYCRHKFLDKPGGYCEKSRRLSHLQHNQLVMVVIPMQCFGPGIFVIQTNI